jgi:hypothetical protein
MMLELIQQDKLVKQDLPQDDESSATKTLDGDLPAPVKDTLEQTVERLNGLAAELVKDAPHLNTGVVVGIATGVGVTRMQSRVSQAACKVASR